MTETVPVAELVRALVMQAVADGLTLAIHVNAQGVRLMPLDSTAHDADAIRADERAATVAACVAAVDTARYNYVEVPHSGDSRFPPTAMVLADDGRWLWRDDAIGAIRRVGEVANA